MIPLPPLPSPTPQNTRLHTLCATVSHWSGFSTATSISRTRSFRCHSRSLGPGSGHPGLLLPPPARRLLHSPVRVAGLDPGPDAEPDGAAFGDDNPCCPPPRSSPRPRTAPLVLGSRDKRPAGDSGVGVGFHRCMEGGGTGTEGGRLPPEWVLISPKRSRKSCILSVRGWGGGGGVRGWTK